MSEQPRHRRQVDGVRHGAHTTGRTSTRFTLWAPDADRVTLILDDREVDLSAVDPAVTHVGEDGWWVTDVGVGHGARYRYRLDDGPARPDPAARWLPDGVHAAAAVLDPSRFTWTDEAFQAAPLTGAVIYELHVGTFTAEGTFGAAIAHLPDLVDLGVTHVEVMPVNAFDGRHGWGYDGVAWWAVHQPYGGPDGFAGFVAACHDAGLAVVLDVVHNHLGPSGNYLPEFGPYLQADAESTWGRVINLDGPRSGPVRRFIIDSALAWLRDFHVDALRLDAVHALDDRGSATHILAELADAVDALGQQRGRQLQLIAETDRNDPQTIRPRAVGGLGMDGQWADDLHHAIHVAVTGETDGYYTDYADPVGAIEKALRDGFIYDGARSTFRQRIVGAPIPPEVSLRRLVACVQNHDQVGNRPAGDRLTTQVPAERLRCAIALLCTAPHTPMLFMGEEYGETSPFQFFSDMPDEDLRQAIRDGRRGEFAYFASWQGQIPDPLAHETFMRSKLDRGRADTPEGRARRRLWRDLLALRRSQPALGTGRRDLLDVTRLADRVLHITRRPPPSAPQASTLLVVTNLSDQAVNAPDGVLVLSTDEPHHDGPGVAQPGRVGPWSVTIMRAPAGHPVTTDHR